MAGGIESLQFGVKLAAGRYLLMKSLGRGGMGEVWMARDQRLDELVALKFLAAELRADTRALEDLRRESARCRALAHPNIVRIFDLHEDESGLTFLAMEYVDAGTLASFRLRAPNRVLGWGRLAPLTAQLCTALQYAHEEGVVHRDLKPANVMVTKENRLKLADFGIAVRAGPEGGTFGASGTLPYMSPQQLRGLRPTPADDIYSLGVTLYELLTGGLPFSSGDITHQILNEPVEPLAERLAAVGIQNPVPQEVISVIMACMEKNPEQRPPSVRAVAESLGLDEAGITPAAGLTEQLAAGSPAAAPAMLTKTVVSPAVQQQYLRRPSRRKRSIPWFSLAAVIVAGLCIARAFWLYGQKDREAFAQWDFNGNLSSARGGLAAIADRCAPAYAPKFAFVQSEIAGKPAEVVAFGRGTCFRLQHGLGGTNHVYLNQYTLIMDVMFTNRPGATALMSTHSKNRKDADWFINPAGEVGVPQVYGGKVELGNWYRLAMVVDSKKETLTSYINGRQVQANAGAERDGRWSMGSTVLIFADDNEENAGGFLNSLQIRPYPMPAKEVSELGGPAASGIPAPTK